MRHMSNINPLLETKEVAEILHCSTHHITTLRKSGLLPGTRLGKGWLYSENDIQHFLYVTHGKDLNNLKDMTPEGIAKNFLQQ